ncbi:MAG TPA: ATP-binding cassette domain-containing protein [Vicinamibacterales bacterium]|nr:ATP-binding cassette domain-containing protein [Vicinamibacterales bacterium]
MPLVTLDQVSIAYGHLPLLQDASLRIESRERVCVIGRNGTGKSTLLQIVSGEIAPQEGSVWHEPGLRIGRLAQDALFDDFRRVFDVVADGLAGTSGEAWRAEQQVAMALSRLQIPTDATMGTLSGGWRRRVLLARALVAAPDLLLLDEPTNHLDIETMRWLEEYLADYAGTVLFVTHDRVFLQSLATRIVELDRGRLTSWPGDYATFLRRKEESLAVDAAHEARFDKRLAEEEAWLRQGIKARRTRNEGRVRALLAMREERAARRPLIGSVRLQTELGERSGQLVFEAERLSKSFGGAPIVTGFSARVMRGDRIGLIGSNGSGKTTLLKLLLGEIEPDAGEVRRGSNVQIAYYDQQREQLDPDRTVWETVADGHDEVTVNGRTQHVHGYLRDFLFPSERAHSPVKALSGGERNRLLLARLFARPFNVLVMDEPTNDLDIETLELLEERLATWPGTLLLVSHDRAFLDHVVTSTLVFEGDGRVQEYIGGYEDWLRQRRRAQPAQAHRAAEPGANAGTIVASEPSRSQRKPSYKEQRELEELPSRIEALEGEQQQLQTAVASADFYKRSAADIHEALSRLEELETLLLDAYTRWDALDSRAQAGPK